MTRPALLSALLFLPWAVPAQEVRPNDLLDPQGAQNRNSPQAQTAQQLANQMGALLQGQPTIKVQAGAEQGFLEKTTMIIPTTNGAGVRIEISGGSTPLTPLPPPPPTNRVPNAIAAAVVLLAAAIMLYQRRAAASAAPPSALQEGSNLGSSSFRIVRSIGEGGMGVVYEAIDTNLDRRVAVKRLRDGLRQSDPEEHATLIKEAKTVASLRHPNIVDIHAVVSQGGQTYLVFEFIEGRTLEQLMLQKPRLPMGEAKAILDPVCRALEYAHGRGIVHRDLKLANVMLTQQGQVKVMDFGIARRVQLRPQPQSEAQVPTAEDYGMTNTLLGTALYQSPESEFGIVRPEVDVYALGVMLYKMLSGDWPFPPPASVDMKLNRRYDALSTKLPALGKAGDELMNRTLEPDPDKRLRSPKEFRERLAALS